MIERRAEAASYGKLRAFLESEDLTARRLTVEWLAGRLLLPLGDCAGGLDQLATGGMVRRHTSRDGSPWFEVVSPSSRAWLRRAVLGLLILAFSIAIVALSTTLHHVFYFAMGLGLGILVAFAWLDWELRSRI